MGMCFSDDCYNYAVDRMYNIRKEAVLAGPVDDQTWIEYDLLCDIKQVTPAMRIS
jgi:hypothetical protein